MTVATTLASIVAVLLSSPILLPSFLINVNADKTPNLCTDGIENLIRIRPSEVNPGFVVPDATAGGRRYDGDAEHFVMSKPHDESAHSTLLVYLPGTFDRPEVSSCLLKSMSQAVDFPTIGLSYRWLNALDDARNKKCATLSSLKKQVRCLSRQHEDAVFGGNYESSQFSPDDNNHDGEPFWHRVARRDSVAGRLGLLLKWLDEHHHSESNNNWHRFYSDTKPLPTPEWNRIVVAGHSQGAGHAAWLSRAVELKGSITISGPQDECVNCPPDTDFWVDDVNAFATKKRTAFVHGEEPGFAVTSENWRRMTVAGGSTWRIKRNGDLAITDAGFALEDLAATGVDLCETPLVTHVKPAPTSTCGTKKTHCSTAVDDSAPYVEKTNGEKSLLYETHVWPLLVTSLERCGRSRRKKRSLRWFASAMAAFTLASVGVVLLLYARQYHHYHVTSYGIVRTDET